MRYPVHMDPGVLFLIYSSYSGSYIYLHQAPSLAVSLSIIFENLISYAHVIQLSSHVRPVFLLFSYINPLFNKPLLGMGQRYNSDDLLRLVLLLRFHIGLGSFFIMRILHNLLQQSFSLFFLSLTSLMRVLLFRSLLLVVEGVLAVGVLVPALLI